MAEQQGAATEAEDRTEEPTQRRLERAREEGETALSSELVKFAALGGATWSVAGPAPLMLRYRQVRPRCSPACLVPSVTARVGDFHR